MRPLLASTVVLLLSSCAFDEPELYDVTGVWALQLRWGAGNCQATGTVAQNLIVTQRDGQMAVTTGLPTETTTAQFLRDNDSADATFSIHNRDARNDGGSVAADVLIVARAGEESEVTGSGRVQISGAVTCSQDFQVSGEIQ